MTSLQIPEGEIPVDWLQPIFAVLPVELTLVDGNDKIIYYSPREPMMFQRTPDLIGSSVIECHSPESRPAVTDLLDKMRDGKLDNFDEWAEKDGQQIHIFYRALRGNDGAYLGCLEIVIDCTNPQ